MYSIGQVEGITLYRTDVVVRRKGDAPDVDGQTRGEILNFTQASRRRLAFVANNTSVTFRTMITLTYPAVFPTDGTKVKRDLKAFLDWIRRETGGTDYLWFLEFQARGAPHIHLLLDYPMPVSRTDKQYLYWRVAATWYRIVGSRDEKHLAAGTRTEKLRSPEGGAHYACKYASKMRQKAIPAEYRNVGRLWGHSKRVKPAPGKSYRCTEDDIRGVLEDWEYAPPEDRPVYRVLYNQADRFERYLEGTIEK